MRIFWICAAVFVFCGETNATPPTKKSRDAQPATCPCCGSAISSISSCEKASEAFDQLLPIIKDPMFNNYPQRLNVLKHFDAFVSQERDTLFCQFSDLETLQDLIEVAKQNGMIDYLVRLTYNYLTTASMEVKALLPALNTDGMGWWTPERVQTQLNFVRTLESTGLLSHDPEGTALFLDLGWNYIPDYTAEPLSDEPLPTQVNRLTNATIGVWSEDMKEYIAEWTGVTISNHDEIETIIQDLLEAANSGLPGLTELMERQGVASHAIKNGYPELVDSIDYRLSRLESAAEYDYSDEGDEAYMDYQTMKLQINENLLSLLESLREMGLLSLEDNL